MPPTAADNAKLRGLISAATSALSLSVLSTAATFAYKGGSDPVTLVAARAAAGFLTACLFVVAARHAIRFPQGNLRLMACFSIGQLMINFGYMTSVLYIPVSLAALIFYVLPVLMLSIEAVIGRRAPSALEGLSFVGAFLGLAFALGPSFETLDWRGMVAALVAAVGGVVVMTTGSRVVRRTGSVSTFFYMQMTTCALTVAVMLSFGGPALPTLEIGWWGLGAACIGYTMGIATQIIAVKLVDPAPASLIYNLEPLATLAIAAWLLAERLSAVQYLGGVFVLASVLVAGRHATVKSG